INNEVNDHSVFLADADFFSAFTFPFLTGNPSEALKDPNSIVITEEQAKLYFNTTDVLGQTLDLKGDSTFEPYKITGVVKKIPSNSTIKFDFITPLIVAPEEYTNNENWFNVFQNTFV